MRVYFAGSYSRRKELLDYKIAIEAMAPEYGASIEVTSRWLLGNHEWHGVDDAEMPIDVAQKFQQEDRDDIRQSDVVVCFTEAPGTGPSRGGRHVEFGIALESGKKILCVGYRENVFYTDSRVDFVPTWSQGEEWLLERSVIDRGKLLRRAREAERVSDKLASLLYPERPEGEGSGE